MQRTYRTVLVQLAKESSSFIPSNKKDVERLDYLETQINLAETCMDNLELLKECFAISYLSDGALSTEKEIISAMRMIDQFLEVTKLEKESYGVDDILLNWVEIKEKQLNQVKDALCAILAHKLNHKNKLGMLEKH